MREPTCHFRSFFVLAVLAASSLRADPGGRAIFGRLAGAAVEVSNLESVAGGCLVSRDGLIVTTLPRHDDQWPLRVRMNVNDGGRGECRTVTSYNVSLVCPVLGQGYGLVRVRPPAGVMFVRERDYRAVEYPPGSSAFVLALSPTKNGRLETTITEATISSDEHRIHGQPVIVYTANLQDHHRGGLLVNSRGQVGALVLYESKITEGIGYAAPFDMQGLLRRAKQSRPTQRPLEEAAHQSIAESLWREVAGLPPPFDPVLDKTRSHDYNWNSVFDRTPRAENVRAEWASTDVFLFRAYAGVEKAKYGLGNDGLAAAERFLDYLTRHVRKLPWEYAYVSGRLAAVRGDTSGAVRAFRKGLDLAPDRAAVCAVELARLAKQAGKPEIAERYAGQAIAICGKLTALSTSQAQIAHRHKDAAAYVRSNGVRELVAHNPMLRRHSQLLGLARQLRGGDGLSAPASAEDDDESDGGGPALVRPWGAIRRAQKAGTLAGPPLTPTGTTDDRTKVPVFEAESKTINPKGLTPKALALDRDGKHVLLLWQPHQGSRDVRHLWQLDAATLAPKGKLKLSLAADKILESPDGFLVLLANPQHGQPADKKRFPRHGHGARLRLYDAARMRRFRDVALDGWRISGMQAAAPKNSFLVWGEAPPEVAGDKRANNAIAEISAKTGKLRLLAVGHAGPVMRGTRTNLHVFFGSRPHTGFYIPGQGLTEPRKSLGSTSPPFRRATSASSLDWSRAWGVGRLPWAALSNGDLVLCRSEDTLILDGEFRRIRRWIPGLPAAVLPEEGVALTVGYGTGVLYSALTTGEPLAVARVPRGKSTGGIKCPGAVPPELSCYNAANHCFYMVLSSELTRLRVGPLPADIVVPAAEAEAARPPEITSFPDRGKVGERFVFAAGTGQPPGCRYRLALGPPGMSIGTDTGLIDFEVPPLAVGKYEIRIMVTRPGREEETLHEWEVTFD